MAIVYNVQIHPVYADIVQTHKLLAKHNASIKVTSKLMKMLLQVKPIVV